MTSEKNIKLGTVLSYITIVTEVALSLIYTPWMLSIIGADNYYLFTLGTSLIAMFAIDFALGSAVTRFIVNYRTEKQFEQINDFLGMIYRLYFFIDFFIFILLVAVFYYLDVIYSGLTAAQLHSFKMVYGILGLTTLITFPGTPLNGIMNAYENFIALKACGLIQKLLTVAFVFIILFLGERLSWASEYCLFGLVTVTCFWNVFFVLVKIIIVRRTDKIKSNLKYFNKFIFSEIFKFSFWVLVMQLADRLFVLVTPSIFAIVSNTDNGAIYSLAVQLEAYAYTVACAINGMFIGKVSRLLYQHNKDGITRLMIFVGKFQMYFLGMITCSFFVIGKDFIRIWAGPGLLKLQFIHFEQSLDLIYFGTLLLFCVMCFSKTQSIAENVILIKGEIKTPAIIYVFTGITYIISTFISTKYYGVWGTFITLTAMVLFRTILLDVYYTVCINMNIIDFFRKCYIPVIAPMFLTLGIGMGTYFLCPQGIWNLVSVLTVVFIVYSLFYWRLSISGSEKNIIYSIFKKDKLG